MEPVPQSPNPALPLPGAVQSLQFPLTRPRGVVFSAEGPEHCFATGRQVLSERGTCIVGMSPGNTYFTEDTIRLLLKGCAEHFSRIVVFIPAASARHTFAALGYSETQAAAKARLKGNNLRHRCERAAQAHGVELEFVDWGPNVISAADYAAAQHRIAGLYERSPEFKRSVKEATRGVLEGRLPRNTLAEDRIERGAQYLLEELAFLEVCPQRLGVSRAAYVYHRRWPVFENLIEGAFDGQRRADVGFVLAAIAGG